MRRAAVVVVGVVALGTLAGPASAHVGGTFDCRWPASRHRVHVYIPASAHGWRIGAAMHTWDLVHRGQPLLVQTLVRSRAQIVVRTYRDAAHPRAVAHTNGVCGVANDVWLNLSARIPDPEKELAAEHELGHTFGLAHRPHQYHRSVMYPCTCGMVHVRLIDKRTIGALYN